MRSPSGRSCGRWVAGARRRGGVRRRARADPARPRRRRSPACGAPPSGAGCAATGRPGRDRRPAAPGDRGARRRARAARAHRLVGPAARPCRHPSAPRTRPQSS
ncbi:hypothetical protein FH969_12045 [Miniimonas arenae]|uniref:Uncharacterized protein n=1 Tax=Miniimonas arenae TaxID=676201 RepID=A0A5C5BAV3_9MICO|nr:hypothetical protein FH969_12045 [Miniimonas arenae]